MMQPPLRANAANTQASIMQRLLLSAQGETSVPEVPLRRHRVVANVHVMILPFPPECPCLAARFTLSGYCKGSFSLCNKQPISSTYGLMEKRLTLALVNGYGIGSTMFPNMASPPQLSVVYLRCAECGIGKTSSEEMEVHIKMEHLQWLPFQCPICSAERASDLQMREHIHSAHRKNSNKFIYVDNPSAKRLLQILMDRSLTSARRPNASGVSQIPTGYGNNGTANGATTARERHFNNADEAVSTFDKT
ncbi:unnamed protein product [Toxocara canis]|uniref:C2H2-type domain-containing protein n=1 Tax=Toxocara canis TaxID=6265 RepID=A0A183V805_TOXCA|nr:unnamed protein product [Toxocara canis]